MVSPIVEKPAVSEALRQALAASESFRAIYERLLHLLQNDADEEDQVFPTSYAYDTALALLLDIQRELRTLPRPNVTADETGGIRLQWIGLNRQVRLIIPADRDGREYVYFETSESYDLEDNPSPTALAQHLRWFTGQG